MGRFHTRLGLLCLVRAAALSGGAYAAASMPLAGFFHSMFVFDGADAEEYEQTFGVAKTEVDDDGEDGGNGIVHQDFLLDNALYSEFNEIGQAQFNILRQKGLDSICWRHAAMSIDADCETMAHSRKQRLAIQLSNCHLQDSGRKGTRCGPKDSDERCVEGMKSDDVAFTSYTTFFHHVNAICYHLSHTVWQEQTQGLVRGLTASSLATFDRAEQSLMKQELVLEGQERASAQSQLISDGLSETSVKLAGLSDSLSKELVTAVAEIKNQESLLASLVAAQAVATTQASSLSKDLDSAKAELAAYMNAIEEDRRAANDQNLDLMRTIGFIHDCLDNASSAWATFQAFTYLILAMNLSWVLTTAPPLRSARTALFGLVAFGLVLEKSFCGDGSLDGPVPVDWLSPETLTAATWAKIFNQEKIRWLTFQAGVVILGHALVSYYLPVLEIGRLAAALRSSRGDRGGNSGNRQGTLRARTGSGDDNLLTDDSDNCNRAGGTSDQTRWRRRGSSKRDDGGGRSSGRASPLFSNDRGGDEPEGEGSESGHDSSSGDSERYGKRDRRSLGSASGSGSGRALARDNRRDDGLEGRTRQELQSMAKETNGAVKANQSNGDIVRGLRELGITAES